MLEKKVERCLTHLTVSPVTASYLRTLCSSHVAANKTTHRGKWIPKWLTEKEHLSWGLGVLKRFWKPRLCRQKFKSQGCHLQLCDCIFLFVLFRAVPMAYGSSQARSSQARSCWPQPQPQPHRIRAASVAYTTARGNTRSLTHERDQGSNSHPHG